MENSTTQKIIEKLVITQVRPKIKNSENKPENEQINTAVQKVLQGYDWTLVPAQIKWVFIKFFPSFKFLQK